MLASQTQGKRPSEDLVKSCRQLVKERSPLRAAFRRQQKEGGPPWMSDGNDDGGREERVVIVFAKLDSAKPRHPMCTAAS